MEPVVVVGGGISGVACARVLSDSGVETVLLDRGRRLGGRMAVRTMQDRAVDTGASYFTVGGDDFGAVVQEWSDRGLARPWTDTFDVVQDGEPADSTTGAMRWSAPGGLRGLVEDLARGLAVERHTVGAVAPGARSGALLVDDRPARAVVLAMPDPQARRLLHPDLGAVSRELDDPYEPVLALSAGWGRRGWAQDFDGAFVNGEEHLAWIADDGRRRGDGAPVLVAHSGTALAAAHLSAPEGATVPMLASLMQTMGITDRPDWTHLQLWSYARPARTRTGTHSLGQVGIGLCGDAWSDKPRVEAAYLSGVALARSLVLRLQG